MEKEFTPLELFALAMAAKTCAELYDKNGIKNEAVDVMHSVAKKMEKYLNI